MFESIKNKMSEKTTSAKIQADNRAQSINSMITKVVSIAIGATVVSTVGINAVDSLSNINTSSYGAGVSGMIELLPVLMVVAFVFLFLGAAGLKAGR